MKVWDIGPGTPHHVVVGEVIKPHGIRGDLKVFPFSGSPDDFGSYKGVWLVQKAEVASAPFPPEAEFSIVRTQGQGRVVILHLAGIETRTEAEAFCGRQVLVSKTVLPSLEKDEYYLHDLEGVLVVTDTGREVGRISGLLGTAGHDILVVVDRQREILIPARKEFVAEVDLARRCMVITPPPGLLEMNG